MPHSVQDIRKYLDKYIIGQEEAKDTLSTVGFMHWLKSVYSHGKASRSSGKAYTHAKKFPNPGVLLIGPSGSGKTYLTQRLAECLDVGYYSTSVQYITNEGFVGKGVTDHLQTWADRLHAQKFSVGEVLLRINYGVLFIDEIDKLGHSIPSSHSADHNLTIQHTLLTAIEGQTFQVKIGMSEYDVRTDNMLIITAGAFTDIYTNRKKANKNSIGFKESKIEETINIHKEVIKAGLIPELVGRLPVIAELRKLDKKEVAKVIKAKDSIFEKYQHYFGLFGLEFDLAEEEIEMIADYCDDNEIGLRALTYCMHKMLTEDLKDLSLDDVKSEEDDEARALGIGQDEE